MADKEMTDMRSRSAQSFILRERKRIILRVVEANHRLVLSSNYHLISELLKHRYRLVLAHHL